MEENENKEGFAPNEESIFESVNPSIRVAIVTHINEEYKSRNMYNQMLGYYEFHVIPLKGQTIDIDNNIFTIDSVTPAIKTAPVGKEVEQEYANNLVVKATFLKMREAPTELFDWEKLKEIKIEDPAELSNWKEVKEIKPTQDEIQIP